MKLPRRHYCPRCGKMYYIAPNTRDCYDIIECIQIAGFALRHCARCGWVFKIEPREDPEVAAIRERYNNRGGSKSQEQTPEKEQTTGGEEHDNAGENGDAGAGDRGL